MIPRRALESMDMFACSRRCTARGAVVAGDNLEDARRSIRETRYFSETALQDGHDGGERMGSYTGSIVMVRFHFQTCLTRSAHRRVVVAAWAAVRGSYVRHKQRLFRSGLFSL